MPWRHQLLRHNAVCSFGAKLLEAHSSRFKLNNLLGFTGYFRPKLTISWAKISYVNPFLLLIPQEASLIVPNFTISVCTAVRVIISFSAWLLSFCFLFTSYPKKQDGKPSNKQR